MIVTEEESANSRTEKLINRCHGAMLTFQQYPKLTNSPNAYGGVYESTC
jgi:hypothetical protein